MAIQSADPVLSPRADALVEPFQPAGWLAPVGARPPQYARSSTRIDVSRAAGVRR
jgi:hypothetical protein